MNLTIVVPTFWARPAPEVWKEGDAVYAHPTPLNREPHSFRKLMHSLQNLNGVPFQLVVIAAATTEEIEKKVEEKVREELQAYHLGFPVFLFSHSHLYRVQELCRDGMSEYCRDFLKLRGYSSIRNLGLFMANLLESDAVLFIDDDEYVDDPEFLKKATEYIGKEYHGKQVYGVSGYYRYQDDYHLEKTIMPWMTYWNKLGLMNKTFEKIIEPGPRLKETPYVFGGCMILHKELYKKLPFDLHINRGEEFDYLVNSMMFGMPFFLDNQWYIRHDPPPASYPYWMQIREEIFTFVYLRSKLSSQEGRSNMHHVYPENFDPFPGYFLQKNLPEIIYKTNMILSQSYMLEGDALGSEECLRNIYLAEHVAKPSFNPFLEYLSLQQKWEKFMQQVEEKRESMKKKMYPES